jgi:glycosyltransferase involved in cell wall biosynthesis
MKNKMKKVDVICPFYINAPIGPATWLKRLLRDKDDLKARGYELEVFSGDFLASKGKEKEVDFSAGVSRRNKLKAIIKKSRMLTVLFFLREMLRAKKLIKQYAALKRSPDVVVFQDDRCCYYYMKRVKSAAKTVLFFEGDGRKWDMLLVIFPKLKGTLLQKVLNRQLDYIYRNLDRRAFVARKGMENFMEENPGAEAARNVVCTYGADDIPLPTPRRSDPSDFPYRLCCTGTVCERKGQHLIVEALHRLDKAARGSIHLTVIGVGPSMEMVKEMVARYGLEGQVRFEGHVPNEQVHEKLCHANIYALMSNSEGLPISIIEGMRAGLAVISTRVAGIPEMVEPGYNGVLVEPDVESLLEVLKNISRYDWKAMGAKSRERFEKEFSFDKMKQKYCDMLDSLMR